MPPMWAILLSMTDGQVDRAMKLETELTAEWFHRWQYWSKEMKDRRGKR